MKIDGKVLIIIVLVGIIGVMAGVLIGQSSSVTQASVQSQVAPAAMSVADPKVMKDYKKNEIMKVIRENSKEIQVCYKDHLNLKPETTEGMIRFILSLNEDGSVRNAKLIKSDFGESDIGNCSVNILKNLNFAPPPLGINRNISHELAFKSEETARREAEEAKKRSSLPKVLPVVPINPNKK